MTDADQLALIYESSILVENAAARIEYLTKKYHQALVKMVDDIDVLAWHENYGDDDGNDKEARTEYNYQLKTYIDEAIAVIVNQIDPTHGKYSEWLITRMIQRVQAHRAWEGQTLWVDFVAPDEVAVPGEDAYKITEALQMFERYKARLEVNQRDINKLSWEQVLQIGERFAKDDPSLKQQAEAIKRDQTIKLIDGVDGWTVVVPLTKDSARLYGAGTRWCTAARHDQHNAFDRYNEAGRLFIFIKGDHKYQWWSDDHGGSHAVNNPYNEPIDVQFMNAEDVSAEIPVVPASVWRKVANAAQLSKDELLRTSGVTMERWIMQKAARFRQLITSYEQRRAKSGTGTSFTDKESPYIPKWKAWLDTLPQ